MSYIIKITKTEANPTYKEELEVWNLKQRQGYNNFDRPEPERNFIIDALTVELTDEQYKKVKAEVLKVFE